MDRSQLLSKYTGLLLKAKMDLENLKKEPDPLTRLGTGMTTLPELKERVLIYRQLLEDLKGLK